LEGLLLELWLEAIAVHLMGAVGMTIILFFVELSLVVVFVVNLFKDWESWLLWSTTSITCLKVGPKAVSISLTTNLFVSLLSKSGTFLESLTVSQFTLKVINTVEILASFAISTLTVFVELMAELSHKVTW